MFCRPARSSSATNGVVFQASARMIGTQAATGWMNQTSGSCRIPELDQGGIHDATLALEHEAPEQGGDHGGNRPGDEHRGADQSPPAEGPVHRQREDGPGDQLEPHAQDREQGRMPKRAPETGVAEAPRRSCPRRRRGAPATACAGRDGGATPRRSRQGERARSAGWCRARGGRAPRRAVIRRQRRAQAIGSPFRGRRRRAPAASPLGHPPAPAPAGRWRVSARWR